MSRWGCFNPDECFHKSHQLEKFSFDKKLWRKNQGKENKAEKERLSAYISLLISLAFVFDLNSKLRNCSDERCTNGCAENLKRSFKGKLHDVFTRARKQKSNEFEWFDMDIKVRNKNCLSTTGKTRTVTTR